MGINIRTREDARVLDKLWQMHTHLSLEEKLTLKRYERWANMESNHQEIVVTAGANEGEAHSEPKFINRDVRCLRCFS